MSDVVREVRGMGDRGREGEKIRVLYVDDEEGAIHVTNIFLKRMGYDNIEITPALSAKQGLELLNDCDCHLYTSPSPRDRG